MTRYTLNVRFLLALIALAVLTAAGVWAAHRRQADKQATLYLTRADALERDGDRAAAAEYLRRYLLVRPGDTAARGRLGLAMADTAPDADGLFRALLVLDQTLREDPTRDDLRRRAAALGLALGPDTLPGATEHYTTLIAAHPKEAGLYFARGKCHELAEKFSGATPPDSDAEKDYRTAVQLDPTHVPAAGRLAGVLRGRLGRPAEADTVIGDMVGRGPASAAAQLAATTYWKEVVRSGSAAERPAAQAKYAAAVAAALALTPTDLAVVQAAADLATAKARDADRKGDAAAAAAARAEAAAVLDRGIAAAKPAAAATTLEGRAEAGRHRDQVAMLYHTRAAVALDGGKFDEAEAVLNRGLEAVPDSAGLIGQLAETYTRAGKLDRAEAQIARLRDLKQPMGLIAYRQARVLAARGDWPAAARTTESALPDLTANPGLAREARYFLGDCFEQIGQPDRRQAALREALPTDPADPLWAPARAKLAAALLDLGRTADAARVLETVAARYADANPPLARLLIAEQSRRPAAARDYGRAAAALDAAPPSAERDLLRIELKYAQAPPKDDAAVRAEVEAVQKAYPDAAEPYFALAALAVRGNDAAAAARWLDAAEKNPKVGDTVALRLVRATLPAADLDKLAAGAEKFPPAARVRLLVGLADRATGPTADAVADRLLTQAATAAPADLGVLLARFERAVRADRGRAAALLTDIRRFDEFGGTSAKMAEALLLLRDAQAKPADAADRAAGLRRSNDLLGEVEPVRPGWSRIPLAQAAVRDLQGDQPGAAAAYRRAVDLGVRDPDVLRRLADLLTAQQRFKEVNDLLRDLPGAGGRLAAEVALSAREMDRAAALAAKEVPADSRDPDALVWLGRVRALTGDVAGAEKPFRRATEVAPDKAAPWVALVQCLAAANRTADAEAATAEAAKKVNAADRPAAVAACYDVLGRPDRAADLYRTLAAERPKDAAVLREAGRHALRAGRAAEAADLFKRALALPGPAEDAAATRRLLALSLATQPSRAAAAEALKVLGDQGARGDEPAEELRARAVALAAQPDRKSRVQAVALLERIDGRAPLGPDDQFLLAQLCAGLDDRPKARRRFTALLNRHPDNAAYLAAYGRWLLRTNDAEAARPVVEKLQAVAADAWPAVELAARLAAADGKPDDAAAALLRAAEKAADRAAPAFTLLEELNLGAKAEPLLDRVAAAAGHPAGLVLRAEFLARRGKVADAVAALRAKAATLPPEVLARATVAVLYAGRKAGGDDPTADALVAEAARRAPGDVKVVLTQGLLADFRGRYDEAERLFRQALAATPLDGPDLALAANNLAFLLTARGGKADEALALVRQAQDAVGPSPDLSDTEGYVQLAKADAAAAAEAFADSLAAGGGPVARYHLAVARLAGEDKLKAATEWSLAHRAGFSPRDLHPLELSQYEKTKKALGR